MGCYVVNTSAEDDSGKKKCAFALEDYYECLHHKKEVRRDQLGRCAAKTPSCTVGRGNRMFGYREKANFHLNL